MPIVWVLFMNHPAFSRYQKLFPTTTPFLLLVLFAPGVPLTTVWIGSSDPTWAICPWFSYHVHLRSFQYGSRLPRSTSTNAVIHQIMNLSLRNIPQQTGQDKERKKTQQRAGVNDDSLGCERAMLGDDTYSFSTGINNSTTARDSDDHLLAGSDDYGEVMVEVKKSVNLSTASLQWHAERSDLHQVPKARYVS